MIIVITSAGKNWVGSGECPPGNMHKRHIQQMLIDTEQALADPAGQLPPKTGTDPEVRDWILRQSGMSKWIDQQVELVVQRLDSLDADEILHVGVRCKGGFQRSPVVAEEMKRRLAARTIAGVKSIIIHHMTMELAMDVKQAMGVA